jgi:hypothetical protein
MKKSKAWFLWGLNVLMIIFSLIQMFLNNRYWIIYAIVVAICFYLTKKIFKENLTN